MDVAVLLFLERPSDEHSTCGRSFFLESSIPSSRRFSVSFLVVEDDPPRWLGIGIE